MSAFILNPKHINVLINYAYAFDLRVWNEEQWIATRDNPNKFGQALVDQNYKSVNYRYREQTTPDQYRFRMDGKPYNTVQIIKACDCYDYQACETPDFDETFAKGITKAIRTHAMRHLPGYEQAEWEIT